MKVAFNTMFKNEEILLNEVLKIWKNYPIDLFIFYDDNSVDSSVDVIKKNLPSDKFIIINDKLTSFNESYQRQRMIDVAKMNDIDFVFSIDCDELLTSNIVSDFNSFINIYNTYDMRLFWYNSVNNINEYRTDPLYAHNYRTFVIPLNFCGTLNKNDFKYHTPRTPQINLPATQTADYGVIHLQAINKRYYAIKQLWYKHHEFVNYGHSVSFINDRYDPVVNNLTFNEVKIPNHLIEGIEFNIDVFNALEKSKGYLQFIKENYNGELITFGKEYL